MKCLHPMYLPHIRGAVPCGKCVNCRINKRTSWIYRLQAEAKLHETCLFLTLTYDDEHLPIANVDLFNTAVPVVSKRDVQLFMKRLRKEYKFWKMRYFCTSEYGMQNGRPHYHMILFGFPYYQKIGLDGLRQCWQSGFIDVKPLSDKAISYVCKYMYEKSVVPPILQGIKQYEPFMLCSRRPGIGYGYLTEQLIDFYRVHPRDYVRAFNGMRIAMPRYFADKLYDDDMKEFLKDAREEFKRKGLEKFFDAYERTTFKEDYQATERKLDYEQRMSKKLSSKHHG